jgi:hypothetical protein
MRLRKKNRPVDFKDALRRNARTDIASQIPEIDFSGEAGGW